MTCLCDRAGTTSIRGHKEGDEADHTPNAFQTEAIAVALSLCCVAVLCSVTAGTHAPSLILASLLCCTCKTAFQSVQQVGQHAALTTKCR